MADGSESIENPVQKMNRMYRWTRHVYDWSRRYYLLGRDRMLAAIAERPESHVLEVGCGTARNLRVLARHAPQHTLYGVDASLPMLATARTKLGARTTEITLGHGLAQNLNAETHLGVDRTFDVIFFSYVLSMIPCWADALEAALQHLSANGTLYVVDFWDQAGLPSWAGSALQRWLALFDVYPRPDLVEALRRFDEVEGLSSTITPVARRYAYLATVQVSGAMPSTVVEGRAEERSEQIKTVW